MSPLAATRRIAIFVAIVSTVAVLALPATNASAAPSNDDFSAATVINPASLPFTGSQVDTSTATTEASEGDCSGLPIGTTARYSFTPSPTGRDLRRVTAQHGFPG